MNYSKLKVIPFYIYTKLHYNIIWLCTYGEQVIMDEYDTDTNFSIVN